MEFHSGESMTSQGTIVLTTFAMVLMGLGVYSAVSPLRVARFTERLDAIGSRRRWDEVEPTNWNVFFTQLFGVVLVVISIYLLLEAYNV